MEHKCTCFIGALQELSGTWGQTEIIIRPCTYPEGACLFMMIQAGIIDLGDQALSDRAFQETLTNFASEHGIEFHPDINEAPIGTFNGECRNLAEIFLEPD